MTAHAVGDYDYERGGRGYAQRRRLRADLASGAWDRRHGGLRSQPEFTGALRLICAHPG